MIHENEKPSVKVVLKAKIIPLEMFEKSLEKMNDGRSSLINWFCTKQETTMLQTPQFRRKGRVSMDSAVNYSDILIY